MPQSLETALYWIWTLVCVWCGLKGYSPWPAVLLVCALAGTVLLTLTRPEFVQRGLATASWPGHVTLYAVLYVMAGGLYLFGSLLALGF